MGDDGDQRWQPKHYPKIPDRITTLESAMEGVDEKLERGEKIMQRIQWMGWVVAAELAVMLASNLGVF